MVYFLPAVPSGWSGLNVLPTLPVSVKALPAFSSTSPKKHGHHFILSRCTVAAKTMAVMPLDCAMTRHRGQFRCSSACHIEDAQQKHETLPTFSLMVAMLRSCDSCTCLLILRTVIEDDCISSVCYHRN